jgi:signal recognition particle receptor subunit beta
MAIYDQEQQKVVVRIVYDGPARAGKTTNMRQLAECFTLRRRSELFVPEEMDGRTLFFDWMQLDGGLVAGEALRCQFLTVPGQRGLAARRKRILQTADVVVFVCSSARRAQTSTREMLETLRWSLRSVGRPDTPIVVQANKQDLDSALRVEELRAALDLPEDMHVVPAAAGSGIGVRETAVLAIRAGARCAEAQILTRGLDALAGRAESAEQLLQSLQQLGAFVLSSEEIVGELADEEEDSQPRPRETAAAEAPPKAEPTRAPPTEPPPTEPPPTEPPPTEPPPTEPASAHEPALFSPPHPRADVPTGCVWPSTGGRQVLHGLREQAWQRRADLAGRRGVDEGSGAADAVVFQVGPWCAKTSPRRRYASTDEGRDALLTMARRKILLGDLLAPNSVVAVQDDAAGSCWLWTVAPWMTTLRGDMTRALSARDQKALGDALCLYARAVVAALLLAGRSGVVLDVHPSNFGSIGSALFYIDDDIAVGTSLPLIGHAILQRVEELPDEPAIATYLERLCDQVKKHMEPQQVRASALIESLESASVRSSRAQEARAFMLEVLSRFVRGVIR